jgi:ubiquinone/menaquinone biosynthesis C-methylase UbiE
VETRESDAQDVKQMVERQFSAAAARYAVSEVHRAAPDLDALVEAAGLTGVERALDVGCGPGHTALALAPRAASVLGIDLSEAMLEQARRLAAERGIGNVLFRRADVERLPFADASFDVVASRQSAHHYGDVRAALAELARVLRPGGRLLVLDTVAPEDPASDTLLNAVELLRDPSHVRDHRPSEWLALLRGAGFDAEQRAAWPLRLGFASWVARSETPALRVEAIRDVFARAPREAREILELAPRSDDFTLPIALFVATRR